MDFRKWIGRCGARWQIASLLLALLWASGISAQELPREGSAAGSGLSATAPGATPAPVPAADTTLTLLGAPPGAEVTIDGTPVGTTPLKPRTPVSPGPHQLRVTRRGFSVYTQEFIAYAGRLVALEINLIPTHMLLRLRASEAGAQVLVDDELRGDAPIELELLPGLHQITVRGPNIQDETFTVTAVAGDELEREVQVKIRPEQRRAVQSARPKTRRFYTRWWVWTLASIGAIGIASAIIIPTVLSQRSSCEKLGGEVCFPIDVLPPALRSGLLIRF